MAPSSATGGSAALGLHAEAWPPAAGQMLPPPPRWGASRASLPSSLLLLPLQHLSPARSGVRSLLLFWVGLRGGWPWFRSGQ
eukprot:NODE_8149_length_1519_cov_4.599138.p8 GENE.NODE_8149_length_1519_cov_4.599138~~NODE_8149_length_1519_cov_4.599138.p8  ORF type:complete len:82 (+),score=11.75 NODE_8149_length_1519_cov_4.599138:976-1221(+)